ncbi:MAG: N-acyl-D-amino-acid deacylase family protein [Burkholderiales bacterium]
MRYDLIIRNGTVIDGSGKPGFRADVAVRGRKIAAIGAIGERGKKEIDATGLIVCPGFVDIHTHYDAQICWDPVLGSSAEHGITTVVLGNCGIGVAPSWPEDREINALDLVSLEGLSIDVLKAGIPWKWETFVDYMKFAASQRPGVNLSFLMPMATLRRYVMRKAAVERAATEDETQQIASLLKEAMEAGANGFSTTTISRQKGWQGAPLACTLASLDELRAYARVLKEMGRGVIQLNCAYNLGSLSDDEFVLLDMLTSESGRPVTWSGGVSRGDQPGALAIYLKKIEPLVARGSKPQGTSRPLTVEVNLNNPFVMTDLDAGKKVLGQPKDVQKKHYADPAFRKQVKEEYAKGGKLFSSAWIDAQVLRVGSPGMEKYLRRTVREIAAEQGKEPIDVFFDLALEDDLNLRYLGAIANVEPECVGQQINDDRILLGMSDGGAHVDMLLESNYTTYILGHWVREKKIMSLERAIYRMTSEPAKLFGITDRGLLATGLAADITVFDQDTVGSAMKATHVNRDLPGGGARLYVESSGISHVIVNGEPLFDHGKVQDGRAGEILHRG